MGSFYYLDGDREVPLKRLESEAPAFETQGGSLLFPDGTVSVDFRHRSPDEIKSLLSSQGVDAEITTAPTPDFPFHVVKPRDGTMEGVFRVANTLAREGNLKAQPRFFQLSRHFPAIDPTPSPPPPEKSSELLSRQWGLEEIKADQVWKRLGVYGSPAVSVAVIDTGFDLDHPDLHPNLLPGWDLEDNDVYPAPAPGLAEEAHGTACAGIIAATGGSGRGILGVAPGCRLIPIRYGKLIVREGMYFVPNDPEKFSNAILKAMKLGASVISISASIASDDLKGSVRSAIETASRQGRRGKGCVIVVAAGNSNGPVELPAAYPDVIAVAASQKQQKRCTPADWGGSSGSCRGDRISVAAPGVDIWTTDIQGNEGFSTLRRPQPAGMAYTTRFRGTSAACPFVAGVAALVLSVNPHLTASAVRELLEETAHMPGGGGRNDDLGHGIVDAFAAVQEAQRRLRGGLS